ncbi:MAG: His/Gly/Thr/Pro-type tRNA ligase C-terminal domain-containing protein, partial [Defluviitaleaceae bacterium]|nr:His/Gly/Thr/Pro-type tRNA ligase C-terminal domain-containing protein [Defluviitaleaceae bacterium]
GFALSVEIAHQLRQTGIAAECDILRRSVKAQMKYADKLNAVYSFIIGENEINEGRATIKKMDSGEGTAINLTAEDLIALLK